MPNWCECELDISGDEESIEKFRKFAKTKETLLDFNKFVPYPKHFADADKKAKEFKGDWKDKPKDGFNQGGYDWRLENWGTKWNASDVAEGGGRNGDFGYEFKCAWSPCCPVVLAMSKKFPDLVFMLRYFEMGMRINGLYVCKNGEVVTDASGDYFGHRGG